MLARRAVGRSSEEALMAVVVQVFVTSASGGDATALEDAMETGMAARGWLPHDDLIARPVWSFAGP
jgi:hypothetical protein